MSSLLLLRETAVRRQLSSDPTTVMHVVEEAYRAHWAGATSNPQSVFLRFPGRARDRIIALPSYVNCDGREGAGIKWISSFPGNLSLGIPRASALIVLNDMETGIPNVVMEGSAISAARTGAFAALASRNLLSKSPPLTVGIIGCGLIAQSVVAFLLEAFGEIGCLSAYDVDASRASQMVAGLKNKPIQCLAEANTIEEAASANIAVFATTAAEPFVANRDLLKNCDLVLHISLRDIHEDIIGDFFNVVDDREHVLREMTSLHRRFLTNPLSDGIAGTLGDFIWGGHPLARDKTIVFSPFGLGALDIALAQYVIENLSATEDLIKVEKFFG